jgi:hypothetical protein
MKQLRLFVLFAVYLSLTSNAAALDVLVCNDDGFTSANTRALYHRLTETGHRVVVAAPVDNQSGRGGYVSFIAPIPMIAASCVDPYTGRSVVPRALKTYPALAGAPGVGVDPSDARIAYVNGLPVMACLYGMDVKAPKTFGKLPDLVISGPNEGNNTGHTNFSSGTVSNLYYAINRGLPAIGVSDARDHPARVHCPDADQPRLRSGRHRRQAGGCVGAATEAAHATAAGRCRAERQRADVRQRRGRPSAVRDDPHENCDLFHAGVLRGSQTESTGVRVRYSRRTGTCGRRSRDRRVGTAHRDNGSRRRFNEQRRERDRRESGCCGDAGGWRAGESVTVERRSIPGQPIHVA